MSALSQHSLPARVATKVLAALIAALGIVIAPLPTAIAHADSGSSDIYVSISPRNDSGLSFKHIPPMVCKDPEHVAPWEDGGIPDGNAFPPCRQVGPNSLQLAPAATEQLGPSNAKSNQQFTIVPASDGWFNLQLTDQGSVVCLAEPSSGLFNEQPCPTSGTWTLQPASDATNYFLIRHVGDNMCIAPSGDVSSGTLVGVSACDGGNTKQQWSITTSDNSTPPAPSNGAAISLGENKIEVCNWGGYAARAVIDYKVKADASSDTETSGHYAIESFPVDQCRTATLPAGKVSATITLRRYTGYKLGDYAFADGAAGSFAGAGENDKITAVWTLGGPHANATYHMYGATCDSSSGFEQKSDSQVFSKQESGQQGCTSNISAADVGAIVNTAWGVLASLMKFF
ncbi:RICIN domain-containing protein [Streptomyces sp. bgisy084]|uniref:RICIN domain-containing protein n=1 Tax=Streptomyces sp. bgisy084 TaxID=3413777 RepID=UPI003D720B3E